MGWVLLCCGAACLPVVRANLFFSELVAVCCVFIGQPNRQMKGNNLDGGS